MVLLTATVITSIQSGAPVYSSSTTVSVVIKDAAVDVGATTHEIAAIDESMTMGTLVDVFNSSDMHSQAFANLGISDEAAGRFDIVSSNPTDTLTVRVEVRGPDAQVSAISAEVGRLGSEMAAEAYNELTFALAESTPAAVSFSSPAGILLGASFFLGILASMIGLPESASGDQPDRRTGREALADWIRSVPTDGPESGRRASPGLLATAALLCLALGLMFTGSAGGIACLVGSVCGLAFLLVLRYPKLLTVGLVILVLFRLSDVGADFYGTPEISIPLVLFVLAVLVIRRLVLGESRTGWVGLSLAIASLVAVMSLSGLTATDQTVAFDTTIDVVKNGLVAVILVALIREIGDLRVAVWTLIGGTAFLSLLGIVHNVAGAVPHALEGFTQAVQEVVDGQVVGTRLAGPIGDANFFGQLLVTIFPLALERAWRERSPVFRSVAVISTGLILWAVVLTSSRGALIGVAACVLIVVFWLRPSPRVLLVAVSSIALALFLLPASYLERIGTIQQVFEIGSTAQVDPSIVGRSSEMLVGLEMFHAHPLTGVGPGNYPELYVEYSSRLGIDYRLELRQPHSLPIEAAAELGLLGLCWWFVAAFLFGRGLLRARRLAARAGSSEVQHYLEALTISFVGFGVTALFLHLAFARFLWMMVGIAVAAVRLGRVHSDLAVEPETVSA